VTDKVLVTGAAGFIGFHLSQRLMRDGFRVVGIDNLNDYYDPALKQMASLSSVKWILPIATP
jgi:UDP-glucuronate 4-epimerase